MVWQVRDLLAEHQIPCFIKNEFASGAMGELSPMDVLPEVWLTDDDWLPRAQRLIEDLLDQAKDSRDWRCQQCDEVNHASFETCWQCGAPSPLIETEKS